MYILMVDDDFLTRQLVELTLKNNGYEVETVDNPTGALSMIERCVPDLLLVDVRMPPHISGFEFVQQLNSAGYTIPVVFVTACNDIPDRLRGFSLRAEDYICKPYDFQELLARVQVVERHIYGRTVDRAVKVGPLELLPDTFEVKVNGEKTVILTPIELRVLTILMNHAGNVVARDKFFDRIWQDETSNVLDVYIARLRRKLGKVGRSIHCQRGVGYVLKA
ncbi:DNA-binding response regulator [Ktedonobacter sp. SOSP1-52]|nr:DNA-binding response regulator [Ktedonobacter sp. SOSP1-52]